MTNEARRRAEEAGISGEQLQFTASDLESLEGRYDTVICLDVFIHYPQVAAEEMVRHLAGMADNHLIVSFAPYTPLLAVLKGITGRGERRETVETLLAQVNLWDVRKNAVAGYSGGMRQRFGVAQALIGRPSLIIVDEPTAGLDPEERNRFNNLLAEIGENVVVILSTHIVEDVTDLCPRMAVLAGGRIVLQGVPSELIGSLQGRVWRRAIETGQLAAHQAAMNVIAHRLRAGRTVIHVLADALPEAGFEPVEASLEDLYFATLVQTRREAAAASVASVASA
jgi:ABC-type multidrug transport system ATPase subunit